MKKLNLKIYLKNPPQAKLMIVKFIKKHTGLSLKKAKDCMDELYLSGFVNIDSLYDINMKELNEDISEINTDECYLKATNQSYDRNRKILLLGLGEEKDYVDFVMENIKFDNNVENFLKDCLSYMKKDDLIEVFKKHYSSI